MADLDPVSLLLTLAGDMTLLRQRLAALESTAVSTARLGELADQLARLSAVVATLQPADPDDDTPQGAIWEWTSLTAEEATDAWRRLAEWVDSVLLPRTPGFFKGRRGAGAGLGSPVWAPCWVMHPDVVDDVTMLYATWHHAYHDAEAIPTRAAEWRDRWLPGALGRIADALKDCHKGGHRNPESQVSATGTAQEQAAREAFMHADIDARTGN
jgi:hypothetical protein